MTVEADLIAEFVADIWRMVVCRTPTPAPDLPAPAADWQTAWVQITGAWRGTVSVSGPPAVMQSLASAVLGLPPERVKESDRADAVGELAAMLAGNLKAILPPPCYLSRPAVAATDGAEPEGVARRRVLKGGFLDPAGPFLVTVAETSRPSGKRRTTLLTTPIKEGGRFIIVASKGGDDRHPDWYRNLVANPDVEITPVDGDTVSLTARVATDEEKAELWPRIVAVYKGYAGYQKKTDRNIPVVICEPRST